MLYNAGILCVEYLLHVLCIALVLQAGCISCLAHVLLIALVLGIVHVRIVP